MKQRWVPVNMASSLCMQGREKNHCAFVQYILSLPSPPSHFWTLGTQERTR